MSYIALKKCSFGGINYLVGDCIPHDAVLPSRASTLIKSKMIAEVSETVPEASTGKRLVVGGIETLAKVIIPIMAKEGIVQLEISPDEVTGYFGIIQMNAEEAIETIKMVDSQDVLIMLDALDPRKTVKAAAKERAEQLIKLEMGNATEQVEQPVSDQPETVPDPQEGGEA